MVWLALIRSDRLNEFYSMPLREWLRTNLSKSTYFTKDGCDWDLLFGAIWWNLWFFRNSKAFDNHQADCESILERSRQMQMITVKAIGSPLHRSLHILVPRTRQSSKAPSPGSSR
ncbi:hypothetical protein V6N11_076986 [Hibiscus sabdariffa]|uniref:Uncharacterized protein n=2 Tax=Hibiscus sabdariffa TaxID=183260 RepID=A0ABR1ZMC6_9ROSI